MKKPGKYGSTSRALDALTLQREDGKPPPEAHPTKLELRKIGRWLEVFQHRTPTGFASDAHIRVLADAAKNRDLDPLVVWWDGKRFALIDGHHRHAAYVRSGGMQREVPVEVFTGTLDEAIAKAARGNSRDKLPMSKSEKTNAAWRLTVTTKLSRKETAEAAGVSEATVANMRRVRERLLAAGESNLEDMTWMRALRGGKAEEEIDWDEETRKRAEKMALNLRKALGKEGGKQPGILALALELYDGRLPRALMEEWADYADEEAIEEEETSEDEVAPVTLLDPTEPPEF